MGWTLFHRQQPWRGRFPRSPVDDCFRRAQLCSRWAKEARSPEEREALYRVKSLYLSTLLTTAPWAVTIRWDNGQAGAAPLLLVYHRLGGLHVPLHQLTEAAQRAATLRVEKLEVNNDGAL